MTLARDLRRLVVFAILTGLGVLLCERWSEADNPKVPQAHTSEAALTGQ